MKRKKSICKSLFTICLILGLAFVLPNIKPVPVIAASKASYEIINKKEIKHECKVSLSVTTAKGKQCGN